MGKSRDAFRTISEVADVLDTPAHVLRFWESKFKQIKPVKRAGGRRYYRPDDVALLAAIKNMLHNEGHAIKDAQKLIRETGLKSIVASGHDLLAADTSPAPVAVDVPPAEPQQNSQPDLFDTHPTDDPAPAKEAPTADDAPADIAASAPDDPAPEATKNLPTLPEIPVARDRVPSRLLHTLARIDATKIAENKAKILPLVARLESLRDEMRHPW